MGATPPVKRRMPQWELQTPKALRRGFLPMLRAQPGQRSLDALITDDGVVWQAD